MKTRNLLYSFLLLSSFTSCQQEDEVRLPEFSDRPILFSHITMETSTSTRADDNQPIGGEFPAGATVGVLGYCLTEDGAGATTPWSGKSQACIPFMPDMIDKPSVLTGIKLTKQLGGDWTYSPLKQWYENDRDYLYSFFAYSPCDPTYFTISTINKSNDNPPIYRGAPIATFGLPYDQGEESQPLDRGLLRDAMLSNNVDHQSNEGNVGFKFYHITGGLRFAVNNFDDTKSVTITSLTLSGTFNKEISIKAQTDYAVDNSYSGTFTIADASMTVAPRELNRYFTEGGIADAKKVTLLLIPNLDTDGISTTMGAPGHTPKVNVTYQMGDNSNSVTQSFDLPSMYYTIGVIHNISLNFLGNSLTLTATPHEWDNEYSSDIVFE